MLEVFFKNYNTDQNVSAMIYFYLHFIRKGLILGVAIILVSYLGAIKWFICNVLGSPLMLLNREQITKT